MCLSQEWFENADSRRRRREENGLAIREAEIALRCYHSTIYPVAIEIADYIFLHWTAKQVARLDSEIRMILFEIWDRHSATPLNRPVDKNISLFVNYLLASTLS